MIAEVELPRPVRNRRSHGLYNAAIHCAMQGIIADSPPPSLFKYRAIDKLRGEDKKYQFDRDIIVGSALWAGSPLNFNDPFDCYPVVDFAGTKKEREAWAIQAAQSSGVPKDCFRETVENVLSWLENALSDPVLLEKFADWRESAVSFGVLSLTERPENMLMWGHYADSHRGYCLEFDTRSVPFLNAYRVKYGKNRPSFRLFDSNKAESLVAALIHKAGYWEYEREWRIVTPEQVGLIQFPPDAMKSVIFGAGILAEDETELRALVAEREHPISLKRVKLDGAAYELTIVDA